jgi:hypothetical protein
MIGLCSNLQSLLEDAQNSSLSYDEFLHRILSHEVSARDKKQEMIRIKIARLPMNHDLDNYD